MSGAAVALGMFMYVCEPRVFALESSCDSFRGRE